MRTSCVALAISACLVACGGDTTLPAKPQIQTDMTQLTFGGDFGNAVYVGTQKTNTLQVMNGGTETLHISDVTITGTNKELFGTPLWVLHDIESTKVAVIQVTYTPKAATGKNADTATLVITSNAENKPTLSIPLSAKAVVKASP